MRALGASLASAPAARETSSCSPASWAPGRRRSPRASAPGLGVRGDVTSPTFVISRVHPPTGDGPPLVHVDAYRLGGVAELDDLDLDTSLDDAVTVVEWGEGIAEGLADDRVEVRIERAVGTTRAADVMSLEGELDVRRVRIAPVGARWLGVPLPALTP